MSVESNSMVGSVMKSIKPMPEGEKFERAFEMVSLYQRHILPFVEQHLGFGEMHKLRSIWQAAIAPIHPDDSDYDRYSQTYSNWLWVANCSHNTLAEQLSSQEILEYKRLLLALYAQRLDRMELTLLRMLKNTTSLAKALLYDMQWITPIETTTSGRSLVSCEVMVCKVRERPGTERICRVDCQNIGANIARQIYHLRRETSLSERGCRITFRPLETVPN
jgi:hypothetical protein